MLINGEKYACDACVRGHRVSNCHHSDRPLQHINKKGRPVSQCNHCRSARKARSSHVKCDCGEKTSKCAHIQPAVDGHTSTCCCNHGGRCSCAGKKEPKLDTVPETESDTEACNPLQSRPKVAARRRRAATVHSSADMMNFDQNGNRVSTSKASRPSHKTGPFTLNRVNSANSAGSLGAASEGMAEAHRGAVHQRRVKSEATSPMLSASGFQMNGSVPPLDLSAIDYPSYTHGGNGTFEMFSSGYSPDNDASCFSAGLPSTAASVDWSHYDFPNEAFGPSSYSQAGTNGFGNFPDFASNADQIPNLINTTSNSGDVSEVEDFMPGADNDYNAALMRHDMMGNAADISTIDYTNFYSKDADLTQQTAPGTGMSMVEDDPAFYYPNYHESVVDENADPMGTQIAAYNNWDEF